MRGLLAGLLTGLALVASPLSASAECNENRVTLRGDWGQVSFTAEIADTPGERSRGLMFREELPKGAGMLFVYSRPQTVAFWMKNTLIPLDMIFLNRQGVVTHVHHRAIPGDLTPVPGGRNVFAVFEINGGLAESYGIAPGSEMQHPSFEGGPAAWPCTGG